MDKIFEMSLPGVDDGQLRALYDHCGDSFESMLEIAVLESKGEESRGGASGETLAYRQLGVIGPDVYTNWKLAFDQQVTRWISAISYRRENPARLQRLSPALDDLSGRLDDFHPDWADVPFMRTVRMLLLLEALLVPEITFASARSGIDTGRGEDDWRVWRSQLHRRAGALRSSNDRLEEMIQVVSSARMGIGRTDWHVSVPLLMLIAVVYSQYEYYASILWQAHSALRARDELQRKWETALKGIPGLEHCLDLVALLIRYQSAVDNYVRQSGDGRFIAVASGFAERTGGAFGRSAVLDALGLMSILEEARLRRLPGTHPGTSIGPCRLNAGTIRPWDCDKPLVRDWYLLDRSDLTPSELKALGSSSECRDAWMGRVFRNEATFRETLGRCLAAGGISPAEAGALVDRLAARARQSVETSILRVTAACRGKAEAPSSRAGHTWAYASRLRVSDDDMDAFKHFVEQHCRTLLRPDDAAPKSDAVVFSFGLIQTRDLRQLLERSVAQVAQAVRGSPQGRPTEAGVKAFRECFRLRRTEIPCCVGLPGPHREVEHVVEVLLREELAAWGLVLPGDRESDSAGGGAGPSDAKSAAELLNRLVEKACTRFGLKEHGLHGDRYLPFPLFERMLEVVARLRPTESLLVAVQFDGRRRRLLRLPTGLGEQKHRHLVRSIANYVHAVVLNQAMTQGFRTCDVSFDGLDDPAGGRSRTADRMTAEKWKKAIKEAYHRNGYEVLLDKYLRDYNTERKSLEFLDVSRPTTLKKPSPEKVPGELEPWIRAHAHAARHGSAPEARRSEPDPADARLLLGLDVGATLTKIQFYSVRSGRLGPVGGAYQVNTPRLAEGARHQGDNPAGRFASELVRSVEEISRSDHELRARFEGGRAIVLSIGVTWPGPVRDNHLAGTSAILADFPPLSWEIVKNRIDEILDLDIAGAFQSRFKKSPYLTKGKQPFVALLNDGDAAGYGTLVIDSKLAGRRLAVVKIGTGTATTVLYDGQLVAGPCEGGKVLLDLGATPAREHPIGVTYPCGVANAYLSRSLLPSLVRKLVEEQNLDFHVHKLGNREIGLFLLPDPRPLRQECGLRDLAEEKTIGVDILRRVLAERDKAEIGLQHQVERLLNVSCTAAIAELEKLVNKRGFIRLAEVLRVQTDQMRRYFDAICQGSSHREREVEERIALFRQKVVEPSVNALGRYLGDFLVLLATRYDIDAFVVAGGVLRDLTGERVRAAAIRRAGAYGFELHSSGSLLEVVQRPPWMAGVQTSRSPPAPDATDEAEPPDPSQPGRPDTGAATPGSDAPPPSADETASSADPGYATAGAAVFAAGEFLLRQKQKGLEELRSKILRLQTNRCATLTGEEIRFDDKTVDRILLASHALGADEVKEFLAGQRTVVQTEGPEGTTRYVRIAAERSEAFEIQH